MHAIRTSNDLVFINTIFGERVGTYSTKSEMHMMALRTSIGDFCMKLLDENIDKVVDLEFMEVKELKK